ncbi:hypothetical protein KHP62_06030 [Rhodobacteraceae bacterium NNCM2]|nr:hypothetical protein [Coraliihabitans acroporae]
MKLSRRTLMIGAAALTGGAAVAAVATRPTGFIEAVIREHFRPGDVSDEDIRRFAEDYVARSARWQTIQYKAFGRLGSIGLLPKIRDVWGVRKEREAALTAFLMGSDALFRTDETQPITYIAFPDPYETGCPVA